MTEPRRSSLASDAIFLSSELSGNYGGFGRLKFPLVGFIFCLNLIFNQPY